MNHSMGIKILRKTLAKYNLPNLPLSTVKSQIYIPDIITRIKEGFIIIDFINSFTQFKTDIGGLVLLLIHRDIIDACVAVLSPRLVKKCDDTLKRIKCYRNASFNKLIILSINEFELWIKQRVQETSLWKPENLIKA